MKWKPAICPTCEGRSLSCPACDGKGRALCHRCQRTIHRGEWASRQTHGEGKVKFDVMFCRECAAEIGIGHEPCLRLVVDVGRKVA